MNNYAKKIAALTLAIICCLSLTGCSAIKEKLTFAEKVKDVVEKSLDYLEMSADELLELSDEELYDAIMERIDEKIADCEDMDEIRDALTDEEFAFYTVDRFKQEVEDGGIDSLFDGSSDDLVPYISECLEIIGADEHKELFDSFVAVNDFASEYIPGFDSGIIGSIVSEIDSLTSDEFDEQFNELDDLEDELQDFARDNIDSF